jgi:transglutaminase-like putative cysteine protease
MRRTIVRTLEPFKRHCGPYAFITRESLAPLPPKPENTAHLHANRIATEGEVMVDPAVTSAPDPQPRMWAIGRAVAYTVATAVRGGLGRDRLDGRLNRLLGIMLAVVASAVTTSCVGSGRTADGSGTSSAARGVEQASKGPSAVTAPRASNVPASVDVDHPLTALKNAEMNLKASIDYSRIDVRARLAKIGQDPRAIAAFVQNETRYEAYSGALRGPRGTLLARAGNAIDRALLLSTMLRTVGFKTRFAQGTLSSSQAAQLVRTGFHPSSDASQIDPELRQIVDRAKSHFIYLGSALHDAGFTAPQGDAGAWDRAIREAQQHCWVQLQSGDGWIDVDPSPGTPYGQRLTTETSYSDELNPALFETLDIQVQVESISNGTRLTKTVLQHTAQTMDLVGVPIGIFHERKGATATTALVIGDEIIKGQSFASTATIGVDGIGKVAVVNPFDTVNDNGADRLAAVWIYLHVTGPAAERQASYTVVDTEGAAARRSGAPPKSLSASDVTAVQTALDSFVGLSVATGDVPAELPVSLLADGVDPQSDTAPVRVLSMFALTECYFRGVLRPSFLNASTLWYIDSPNVVIARLQPATSERPAILSLDLSLKGYRSLRTPDDPLLKRGPFYDYLAAGVIDHTLERWLLGAAPDSGSVGALFETATSRQVKARVLKPASDQAQGLPLTTDGQTRLSDTLATGRLVVIPAAIHGGWKASAGWWSIDPATGWTEDVTEGGYHASDLPERSLLQKLVAHPGFKAFCALSAVVSAATGVAASITKASWVPVAAAVGGTWAAVCAVVNAAAPPPSPPSLPPPPGGVFGPPPPPWSWWPMR